MTEGFYISLWGLEADATGIWGMGGLSLFILIMGFVLQLLPVLKRWLQQRLK